MSRSRCWLCVPPFLLAVLDGVFTLYNQPATYWAGDFGSRNELNPLFDFLLARHPLAFVAGVAVWVMILGGVISLVSDAWALRFS